ncbi:MAG TPA: acetylxylan esterase [Vicinamibacteria bacterium]|nr:acetylxylan esterase [Vicinamibacteria bacterium]
MIATPRAALRLAVAVGLAASVSAQDHTGTVRVSVVPDHADWTYALREPVAFKVTVTRDGHPLKDATVAYTLGPERMKPVEEKTVSVPADGLVVRAKGMDQPGFLRLIATAKVDGMEYRGLATAGYAPERIQPTVPEPADFDAFWDKGKQELAAVPMDAKLTPMPTSSTAKADCWHVSLQNIAIEPGHLTHVYGVLCEPMGDGPFPALLSVPGAGVRAYRGQVEMAERGIITFQIGINGIPVNLEGPIYDDLRWGALSGYRVHSLDDRNDYYYRRVYLGCLRANDFLVSRPRYDGRTLGVAGGSQGGALTIVTAGLDPRVKLVGVSYPALADTTGYLHGRAGGWPHMFQDETRHRSQAKIDTIAYYDVVNFARRLRVPGLYAWGFNDETTPPTSMYAAYNVITAEKSLLLALEMGHPPVPEVTARMNDWLERKLKNR